MRKQALMHLLAGAVIIFFITVGCPFYRLTGVMCPTCGTSRAYLAALTGDLHTAFQMNLFFPFIPPLLFLMLHAECKVIRKLVPRLHLILIVCAVSLFLWNLLRVWYTF